MIKVLDDVPLSQHSYIQSFIYCIYCKSTLMARVHSERMLLLGEGGKKERKDFSETKMSMFYLSPRFQILTSL